MAERTYHGDTYHNTYGYLTELRRRLSTAFDRNPEDCTHPDYGTNSDVSDALATAKTDLAHGRFGVEQAGH